MQNLLHTTAYMINETGMQQQYCLRWNNHRANLQTVFSELFRNENFADVSLACEGDSIMKCHKMVLAACSSYFHRLFSQITCEHPVVVLKDVQESEMQAILEYMYKGEVNITQEKVEPLLRVAETLKVKGLFSENSYVGRTPAEEYNTSPEYDDLSRRGRSVKERLSSRYNNSNDLTDNNSNVVKNEPDENTLSPTSHSMDLYHSFHKSSLYHYGKSTEKYASSHSFPSWTMPALPVATSDSRSTVITDCFDYEARKMSSVKRKRSTYYSNSDPPSSLEISRCQSRGDFSLATSVAYDNDYPGQRSPPCRLETSQDGSCMDTNETTHSPLSPQYHHSDSKREGSSNVVANVPSQKPEGKRYKQYTRQHVLRAIEDIQNGMRPQQAACKWGVPPRTMYDKVKKMGIATTRGFRKANGRPDYDFPYIMSGINNESVNELGRKAILEPRLLQSALVTDDHVKNEDLDRKEMTSTPLIIPAKDSSERTLDSEMTIKREIDDTETISVIQECGSNNLLSSISNNGGSCPNSTKNEHSILDLNPSCPVLPHSKGEYQNQVEDLSVSKKSKEQSRVITSPVNQDTVFDTSNDRRRD